MTKAIQKILYAADAKESPLPEAIELIIKSPWLFSDEAEWDGSHDFVGIIYSID